MVSPTLVLVHGRRAQGTKVVAAAVAVHDRILVVAHVAAWHHPYPVPEGDLAAVPKQLMMQLIVDQLPPCRSRFCKNFTENPIIRSANNM
jgi:hypothetical protein